MRSKILILAVLFGVAACSDKPAATTAVTGNPAGAAAAATAGTKDWVQVMAATPEGGFRIGNPDAPVKLVEYASFTCPHCKDFHEEAAATIRSKYVASGKVSYEFRNFIFNAPDYAAALLARCETPAAFFNLTNAFFQAQTQWLEPFTKLTPDDQKRLSALPQDQQIAALAKTGGLDAFMRARGMTAAKFENCLKDEAAIKRLAAMRDEATGKLGVTGTPSFFINGKLQESTPNWSTLQPKLESALS